MLLFSLAILGYRRLSGPPPEKLPVAVRIEVALWSAVHPVAVILALLGCKQLRVSLILSARTPACVTFSNARILFRLLLFAALASIGHNAAPAEGGMVAAIWLQVALQKTCRQ